MSDGLGPKRFDCSGLIITSYCDVLGKPVGGEPRHVRELWAAACNGTHNLSITGQEIGSLLVTKRTYTIAGNEQVVAGHIGVVADISEHGVHYLHANPRLGRVEEILLPSTVPAALGIISLAGLFKN